MPLPCLQRPWSGQRLWSFCNSSKCIITFFILLVLHKQVVFHLCYIYVLSIVFNYTVVGTVTDLKGPKLVSHWPLLAQESEKQMQMFYIYRKKCISKIWKDSKRGLLTTRSWLAKCVAWFRFRAIQFGDALLRVARVQRHQSVLPEWIRT